MKNYAILGLLVLVSLVSIGCYQGRIIPSGEIDVPSLTFTDTSYISDGLELDLLVDTRIPMLSGPTEFMPLVVAVVKKNSEPWQINRESFVLELPDRTRLPVISHAEFISGYGRARTDLRIAKRFINILDSVYSAPPFFWRQLDFFPPQGSATVPREDLSLRQGQVAVGLLYFRLPESEPTDERYIRMFNPMG